MSAHLQAALVELTAKRDTLNGIILALEGVIGTVAQPLVTLPPPMGARPARKSKGIRHRPALIPRPRSTKGQPRPPSTSSTSAALAAARDAAILKCLERTEGIAKFSLLKAAMPKEPDLDAAQQDDAYRNTMTRLKKKGLIGRTGDVWSLVGVGSQRA